MINSLRSGRNIKRKQMNSMYGKVSSVTSSSDQFHRKKCTIQTLMDTLREKKRDYDRKKAALQTGFEETKRVNDP